LLIVSPNPQPPWPPSGRKSTQPICPDFPSHLSIDRPGFERLLAAICESRVGAVLAIEASRLARNGRDWHTLIG